MFIYQIRNRNQLNQKQLLFLPAISISIIVLVFGSTTGNNKSLTTSKLSVGIETIDEELVFSCKLKTTEIETDCRDLDLDINQTLINSSKIPREFIGFAQDDDHSYDHDTHLVFDDSGNGQVVAGSGLAVSLYYDLAEAVGFRPTIQKGLGFGEKLPNGSWTGMPGQLLDPQHDALDNVLSISSSTLTVDRVSKFTFLQPTYTTNYLAHFRSPPHKALSSVLFLLPFKTGVWQSILVVSILSVFILKAIYCFRELSENNERTEEFIRTVSQTPSGCNNEWKLKVVTSSSSSNNRLNSTSGDSSGSFSALLLWIVSNVCQKGWALHPTSNSMRILIFTTVFCTTVLYTAYSAVLVSILSVDEEVIFTDLNQLRSQQMTIYGDEDVPFVFQIIEASISASTSNSGIPTSSTNVKYQALKLNTAVHKVLTSRSAIVTLEGFYSEFRRQNFSLTDYCRNITTIRIPEQRRQAGMYVRRQWKYKEVFAGAMIKILGSGLNFRYNKIANDISDPQCAHGETLQATHLKTTLGQMKLQDTISAFILLAIGFAITLSLLFLEILYYYLGYALREWNSSLHKFLRP